MSASTAAGGPHLFERPGTGERALLVHVELPGDEAGEDLDEFRELAESAGARVVDVVTAARERPEPRWYVGVGKVDEIHARAVASEADLVIFGRALTPAQERNLERRLERRVLDRIGLILDIFAQRASSFEGKLQVELAQLRHVSTRLVRGWSHLERQKGGIGLRGPGEKQLETDRRLVTERIRQIERRLERVRTRRDLSGRARRRAEIPVVSIVGYTNAGKSTLFNALTGARVHTEDRLFATLDPTLRRLELPGLGHVIVADTVGFIRRLPHELVAAFRSTLEETRDADLLVHVVDATAPDRDARRAQVDAVLEEIGAGEVRRLLVLNKIDALAAAGAPVSPRVERDADGEGTRVWLSARYGIGIDLLLTAIREALAGRVLRCQVRLPATAGRLRARLFALGAVVSEAAADDGGWCMELAIAPSSFARLCRSEDLGGCVVRPPAERAHAAESPRGCADDDVLIPSQVR